MQPSQSASAFMDDLLSGLQAPAEPSIRAPPPRALKSTPQTSVLPSHPCTLKQPSLSNCSSPKKHHTKFSPNIFPTPSLPVAGSTACDARLLNNAPSTDLFEGIEDWGDFDLEEDTSPLSIVREEPTPLCEAFIKCRVEMLEKTRWNPLKKRMERQIEVVLERSKQSTRKLLLLCDEWIDSPLERGNSLNLVSFPGSPPINLDLEPLVFSRSEPGHVVILFPSLLVSASIVANAPMCSRRSILSSRLKLSSNEVGEAVVRGNIVHETIQNLLLPQDKSPQDSSKSIPASIHQTWQKSSLLEEAQRACVRRLSDLFMIGRNVEQGVRMVEDHLEHIPKWASKYLIESTRTKNLVLNKDAVLVDPRSNVKVESDQPRIGITGIIDTEEEIWSPKYGLKGKIDVSVQAMVDETPSKQTIVKFFEKVQNTPRVFPLEIKTGKQPSGIEHIAQTMLYTLLMSDRYNVEVTAGLLYYTSRDDLIRVRAVKDELRHLIIARNQLAYYLHSDPSKASLPTTSDITDVEDLASSDNGSGTAILPEPIDRDFACRKCFEVEGCMLYRKAVEGVDSIPPQKGIEQLEELYQRKTRHLTKEHTEFFRRWESLISYEETELGKSKKQIWNMSAAEREQAGNAFANMTIDYSFNTEDGAWNLASPMKIHRYIYCLKRSSNKQANTPEDNKSSASLLLGHMTKNDPVVISIQGKKLGVARGFILELTPQQIIVGLDHRLEESDALPLGTNIRVYLSQHASAQSHLSSPPTLYRIDKDELMAGMGRIRDNLAQLFLENGNKKLRELVVDLRKPQFDLSTFEGFTEPSNHLNEEQVAVLTKVLTAEDYALVLGMPGTGKTTTIVELIKTLIKKGNKVLLTSYTHSAVDNILSKLIESDIDMLRLGNVDKVSSALHPYTLHECDSPEFVEQLETRLMSPPLVATTSLSINHPIFSRRSFDYCIVDEASQITLPTCLGPLRYAKVFVLVGDHYQLPPLVKNPRAKAEGLETSLFKLLTETHPEAVASLTMQYRMNEDIMSLSNALIYDGRLRSGDKNISNLGLEIPYGIVHELLHGTDSTACNECCWLSDLMDPERKVVFANTDLLHQKESKTGNRLQNDAEAQLVFQLVNALIQSGVPISSIGIITPYRQQLKLLASLSEDFPDLEILTADKSQGRDKDCIIMTMVRNNMDEEVGELLKDWRRINVCLTRAKKKLVLFGSMQTLKHSEVLNDLFTFIEKRNWVYDLEPGCVDIQKSLSSASASTRRVSLALTKISPTKLTIDCSTDNDNNSNSHSKRCADHFSPVRTTQKRTTLTTRTSLSSKFNQFGVLRDVTTDFLTDNNHPNR